MNDRNRNAAAAALAAVALLAASGCDRTPPESPDATETASAETQAAPERAAAEAEETGSGVASETHGDAGADGSRGS